MITRHLFSSFLLALALVGCAAQHSTAHREGSLNSITVVDRNGVTESFSNADRLRRYEGDDFTQSQPYEKVLRVFERDKEGRIKTIITSYHPNGGIRQYLEGTDGRAKGAYREWHANGNQKVESEVVGGALDLSEAASESWLFDGESQAWNEEGQLVARVLYSKGKMEGTTLHYHGNGELWKELPYRHGQLEGEARILLSNGQLFGTTLYHKGQKHGEARRFWEPDRLAFVEEYQYGRLKDARYYGPDGQVVANIKGGNGFRAAFSKYGLSELQEYRQGRAEGLVKQLGPEGQLQRSYSSKNGQLHGPETVYGQDGEQPSLKVQWVEGLVQGEVKTWYPNGQLESQREMHDNKKHGLCTAWYSNGDLMLIEEYQRDKLVRGEYRKLGETVPVSTVREGSGLVTLFSPEGEFMRRINYEEGEPVE